MANRTLSSKMLARWLTMQIRNHASGVAGLKPTTSPRRLVEIKNEKAGGIQFFTVYPHTGIEGSQRV